MSQGQKVVAEFSIRYSQHINEQGQATRPLPAFAEDSEALAALYKTMVLTRTFDKKAIALQRTGKLGTYPSTLGQEAIAVGVGAAMDKTDVLCPYYREYGAQFWRGVKMEEILLYWGGDERGSDFSGPREDFPISVPIGSQTLYATGVAMAMKLRKQPRVAVAFIGDGGTSRGDFYEALNVAGAWHLPVVFIINNNQWAISVPRGVQTGAKTLAQKAIAGGVPSMQVDGNDVIGVREAAHKAITRAREGKGASVIEAITYRMCDHTTADDASRYRSDEEVQRYKEKDPIIRLRTFMASQGFWDQEKEKALYDSANASVAQAVENYLNTAVQPAESMMSYLYETLPQAYVDQLEALERGEP